MGGFTSIPFSSQPWVEQPTQSQPTQAAAVPAASPAATEVNSKSANPVLDSLSSAVRAANDQVTAAAERVRQTPQYNASGSSQPVMPPQKAVPLSGASVNNLKNEPVRTAAGAKAKGIGLIAAQAGSFVSSYLKKKQDEKTQQLAIDLNRSLELTQGIDEAKQLLQSDPNNAQAKAALAKNQALLGNLLSDPKKAKAIGKAYDVTFGEEAKDKANTPEAKAMQGALRAAKLQQEQPQRFSANPAYAAAQSNLANVQKQADAAFKTYTTMADTVYKEQGANARAEYTGQSRIDAAKIAAGGKLQGEQDRASNELILNRQKHQERLSEIGAQTAGRIKAIKEQANKDQQQQMGKTWLEETDKQIKDVKDQMETNRRKAASLDAVNAGNGKELTDANVSLQKELDALHGAHDQALGFMFKDPDSKALYDLTYGLGNK